MAEIATWSAILNKTGLGKTSNECPTKAELLALNNGKDSNVDKVIVISKAASYGNNECVKLEDINAEQWIYTFQWDSNGNPSFNAPATGGTYPFGSYASNRVKQVNGVNTSISQSLVNGVTKTSEGSWYTTDYDGNKGRIVPNNTSTNSKSITVTWTQKYSGKTLQATFTQAAGRKVYSSWSYNCRVDKTSFSYSGGQSNVTAKSASRSYTWNGQGSSYTESETATVRVSSPASISGNSISIPSNSGSARNFTVTFDFPTATDQTISISQEAGDVYEFYITDSEGNGHYTDFTFSAPSNGLVNKHVLNIISTHNGSPLSVDDVEKINPEIENQLIGIVLTTDSQSPFRFMANITEADYSVRTAADTLRQKPSGKTVIFRVNQEGKNNFFSLELSLNISNGSNDQDTWGLFDTANMPHTSDFMYDMSLIREGIIVNSIEGKIKVNSIQSTTKDITIGDTVYVWAYNSVRGLWLSIGNFRIEEGTNMHHWDTSWPS